MSARVSSSSCARAALCVVLLGVGGCGGAAKQEEAARAPDPAPAPAAEPADVAPEEPPAEEAEASEGAPSDGAAEEEPKGRNILYRMTPKGLVIDVEGVEFKPKATAVAGGGGYRVKLDVSAKAKDDQMHRLLAPEGGPLMVAARIEGRGEPRDLADKRDGDDEMFVMAGDAVTFDRTIPATGEAPARAGDSLTLHVGLWGLGLESGERRPVRKLFVVKMMVGRGKPQPVVSPPE